MAPGGYSSYAQQLQNMHRANLQDALQNSYISQQGALFQRAQQYQQQLANTAITQTHANYLNQLAQTHPIIAEAVEEIEEETEKAVVHIELTWRRAFDWLMQAPIKLIDRVAQIA